MTQGVQKVHLVFKTHHDIGFTDTAPNVIELYMRKHIPNAVRLARRRREAGSPRRFVWSLGSWFLWEYLEQADPIARREMDEAIAAGDIAWLALPFTPFVEAMDASLLRYALSLSQRLDKRYGKETIAAKLTDVPSHTRAMVPILAEAGVKFLHIGGNPVASPPDVPPLFVWRAPSGEEILVAHSQNTYGSMLIVNGCDEALYVAQSGDNKGPQTEEQLDAVYRHAGILFAGAELAASTFDAFARAVWPVRHTLPVVTSELGDTWIYAIGTDPAKLSQYRALCRLRSKWLAEGVTSLDDPAFDRSSRFLMLVPEHTWSADMKTYLDDYEHYLPSQLARVRNTQKFRAFEATWDAQRSYVRQAVAALDGTKMGEEARAALAELQPRRPDLTGYTRVNGPAATCVTPLLEVEFSKATGTVTRLVDRRTGRDWAEGDGELGRICLESFSQAEYDRFRDRYMINLERNLKWAMEDFCKPGIEKAVAHYTRWEPEIIALWEKQDEAGWHLVAEYRVPLEVSRHLGLPQWWTAELFVPMNAAEVQFKLQWFSMTASRLPMGYWFMFRPAAPVREGWQVEKVGEWMSPLDIVNRGGWSLHGITTGVRYQDDKGSLLIESLDAGLVAPGEPALVDFPNTPPPVERGMHFNLYNNIWGTNFPLWYDQDALFRFRVVVD